jgi:hypothetical protein
VLFALSAGHLVQKQVLGDVDPDTFVASVRQLLPGADPGAHAGTRRPTSAT